MPAEAWLTPPWIVLGALGVEAALGYPAWLHRCLPHPVVWIGALISRLERAWNRPERSGAARRALGVLTVLILVALAAGAGVIVERLPPPGAATIILVVVLGGAGLAGRSLFDHVSDVSRPLAVGDLEAARAAVGRIVGRDTQVLDESGVATAAIESLAESFSDGVVAPAFWFLVAGLPGLLAYKAVNTADSMIGHMEPRWRRFGWAAARLDDLLNLVPARLSGALIALAAGRGWRVMLRDAREHASPNAGWPEAAMAGALDVRLGGPVAYDGVVVSRPGFGDGRPAAAPDLKRAVCIYLAASGLLWLGLALGGLAWPR